MSQWIRVALDIGIGLLGLYCLSINENQCVAIVLGILMLDACKGQIKGGTGMSECMTQEDAMNMSNEQAIQILKPLREVMIDQHGCPVSDAVFALDKAIAALSQHQPGRKKGQWINEGIYGEGHSERAIRCSNCDWHYIGYLDDYKFCPNCGADMRGEEHGRHL